MATKRKSSDKAVPNNSFENAAPFSGTEDRFNHIVTAACFKAEAYGLNPGQELEDWLETATESNDW